MSKKSDENPKKLSQEEYEKKVLELSNKGLTAEKIGEQLKKQGIHPKEYSGKISQILGKRYINPELANLEKKLARIEVHSQKNLQDKKAKRERSRVFSGIRKVKRY